MNPYFRYLSGAFSCRTNHLFLFLIFQTDLAISDSFEFDCDVMPELEPDLRTEEPIAGGSDGGKILLNWLRVWIHIQIGG